MMINGIWTDEVNITMSYLIRGKNKITNVEREFLIKKNILREKI